MVKITVNNYRDSKDYGKIVAAVGRVLARQRYVSPIEVFVEMGLLMVADLERWKRGGVPYLRAGDPVQSIAGGAHPPYPSIPRP